VRASGSVALRVLRILQTSPIQAALSNQRITTKVRAHQSKTRGVYGSRRMKVERDEPVGRNRVARLMRESGLLARTAQRYRATTNSKHGLAVAPNLLEQNFTATEANRVWVADITYVWSHRVGLTWLPSSTYSLGASLVGPSESTCAGNLR
jgi:transposase InsO family protein